MDSLRLILENDKGDGFVREIGGKNPWKYFFLTNNDSKIGSDRIAKREGREKVF